MEPIQLIKHENDLSAQLDFLISLEFRNVFRRCLTYGIYLIGITLLIVLLLVISDNSNYIAIKGVSLVMLPLIWIFTLGYLVVLLIRYQNRKKWKQGQIQAYLVHATTELYFDDELISYKSDKYSTSLKWDLFTYFKEHRNSIFIFNNQNTYQGIYFSDRELGVENFQALKIIVSQKLKPLP